LLKESERGKLINAKCHKVHQMLKTMKKSSVFSKLFTKLGRLSFACETKVNSVYFKNKGNMQKANRWKKESDQYLKDASIKINSMKAENPQAAAAARKIINYINSI